MTGTGPVPVPWCFRAEPERRVVRRSTNDALVGRGPNNASLRTLPAANPDETG